LQKSLHFRQAAEASGRTQVISSFAISEIDVNLPAFNVATIPVAPELFLNALNHRRSIVELEALRHCRYTDAVTQSVDLVTHAGDNLSPGLLRFGCRHGIQLIHHRVTDFETNYRAGFFHLAADCCPAVPSPS